MSREEALSEIMQMLVTKREFATLLDKMTKEIDIKAKQVELKPCERTKLILRVNGIMNHKS